jgi:hypothetical protein
MAALTADVRRLTGQESNAGALGVLAGWKANAAETAALRSKLDGMEQAALKADLKGKLDAAVTAGKLPPARRAEIEALATRDGKVTEDGLKTATICLSMLGPQVTVGAGTPMAEHAVELSPTEQAIARATGTDPQALAKFKIAKAQGR